MELPSLRLMNVQHAKLQRFNERDNLDKFRLSLNGQDIPGWFKRKYQEVKQTISPHAPLEKPELNKPGGIKR